MNTFDVSFITYRICRFDYLSHKVESTANGTLAELSENISDAVNEAMTTAGWRDGACPSCAIRYAALLHGEHNANRE